MRTVRVLVTGANGFLGRHVVAALAAAGHRVWAGIRCGEYAPLRADASGVDVVRCDLASGEGDGESELASALDRVDAVVHLAAAMRGDEEARERETVRASERFFAAVGRSPVRRVVLASSFSVYDWLQARGEVDETLPLAKEDAAKGGYARAKLAQERLARRAAHKHGWQLTVLRPGFVWGPGRPLPPGSIGRRLGPFHLVFSPRRALPFTYVENCADCIRSTLEDERAIGATLNVVDGFDLTPWRLLGEAMQRSGEGGVRLPVPYAPLWWAVLAASALLRSLPGGSKRRLPSLLMPAEFAQNYRPLCYRVGRLESVLGWSPPLPLEECLRRTWPLPAEREAKR